MIAPEHEPSFRAAADYTYDWESWIGPDGKPVWINPAVVRMTGYTVAECLAMPDYPLPIVARRDRRRMKNLFASALAGSSGNDVEFQIAHRSGATIWMAISWQPICDDRGQGLGYRTSTRDIQQRKAAEAALRRSEQRHRRREERVRQRARELELLVRQRSEEVLRLEEQRAQMTKLAALGELAAAVAHEINNPLAGIKNAFRLVREEEINPQQHALLGLIDSEIDRISSIVRQMYQLYRYQPQTAIDFDLRIAIEQVCRLLEGAYKAHQGSVHVHLPESAAVRLPEGEVKQVLYNLIRNGLEASPDRAPLEVTLAVNDSTAFITVRDHGAGIDAETMPHIFEPFFSTKKHATHEGLGLGLSVSLNLVHAMGGTLEAESRPGDTTFRLTLPRNLSAS